MSRIIDVLTSFAASAPSLGAGMYVGSLGPRPDKLLELYEFEACPFCRRVREALTMLDLDAVVHPCPKGGTRFRPELQERGGRNQFPYLVDPNTGTEMYESADIVRYLYETYGAGAPWWSLRGPRSFAPLGSVASAIRFSRGMRARASRRPEQPLELWSFEASPYCRIAREALCSFEIPYVLHNVGKGSPKRKEFIERSGRMMVPYLVDPNTGARMFESADIVAYLEATYAGASAAAA